jgi:hypothetical protein
LADYFGNAASIGVRWPLYFLFGFVAAMTATRVFIAWVYSYTGSVLLAQLMHASSTGFLYALGISASSPLVLPGTHCRLSPIPSSCGVLSLPSVQDIENDGCRLLNRRAVAW